MWRGCNDCRVGPVFCISGSTASMMLFPFLGHSHCLGR